MIFSYNWLQSYFKEKLPDPEKLAELLSMRFAEVEEVKKKGNDFVLGIDIRPNRAGDSFSHFGLAREVAAILGFGLKTPSSGLKENKKSKTKDFVSIEVKDKKACSRYALKAIEGLKVASSPKWLKERLKSCGLRPINNIVDIANYVMLETGQPLHAFDFDKIESSALQALKKETEKKKIIVRFARKGEKIATLDKKNYDLDKNVLVIASQKEPIAIAGIKGGRKAEVDKKTKKIILEAANFDSKITRKSSRFLKLRTDASLRFEHGLDPNLVESAIERAAFLIGQMAKGRPAEGLADYYPEKVLPKTIRLNLDYLQSLLGKEMPKEKTKSILKSLGFEIVGEKNRQLSVKAPTRRLDVSIEEDLVEEVGRVYGYEKIPSLPPLSPLVLPEKNISLFWEDRAKDIFKELGFFEVLNYSFFGEKEAQFFGYPKKELIGLENPLSQEYKYLRTSLIPGLLKNAEKNFRDFEGLKIFELGKVFSSPREEKRRISGLVLGQDFYCLKGMVDFFLRKMGIGDFSYNDYSPGREKSVWQEGKSALIKVKNKELGFLGEASLKIKNELPTKGKIVLFDIDFELLSSLALEKKEYHPVSKFPLANRDIAVLVPRKTKAGRVLEAIYRAGGKMVEEVELFDLYQGKEIGEEKKNLAFRIVYQPRKKTLSSLEIDEIQDKIIKSLEKNPEWKVRK